MRPSSISRALSHSSTAISKMKARNGGFLTARPLDARRLMRKDHEYTYPPNQNATKIIGIIQFLRNWL